MNFRGVGLPETWVFPGPAQYCYPHVGGSPNRTSRLFRSPQNADKFWLASFPPRTGSRAQMATAPERSRDPRLGIEGSAPTWEAESPDMMGCYDPNVG